MSETTMRARSPSSRPPVRLTPRQRDILSRLAGGQSPRQIGAALGLPERLVRDCLEEVCILLRAASAAEAVEKASRRGLLDE